MYKIKDTPLKDLKNIEIRNQAEIIARTKRKLDPVQAYEIIKKESKDFTLSDPKVQEADELLFMLLNRDTEEPTKNVKKEAGNKKSIEAEEIRIRERERARALELLELELELELNTKSA